MKRITVPVLVAALLLTGDAALAHRFWLLPSTFTLSGEEQWITVDGAVSNNLFYPNHVPLSVDDIVVTAPDGSKSSVENASRGKLRSVFDVHLTQQGTYRIGETGRTFFASWTEDGERQRQRGSLDELKAAGVMEKEGAELTVSRRAVMTYVTLGEPTDSAFAPTGEGLELVPETHPSDLFSGDDGSFRFLINGEPAAGLEVTVVQGADRYRNEAGDKVFTTGADGRISVPFTAPGTYWLSAGTEGETEVDGMSIGERNSLVLTFEVLPE